MPQVVIANRLRDGIVVFLGTDHRWVERLETCPPAATADEGAKLLDVALEAEARQEIVGPTVIDVEEHDGALRPIKMREVIRAKGPTVRRDLGKQAGS
jgi:sulfite reductase (NADPH) hemoprotein beta-component